MARAKDKMSRNTRHGAPRGEGGSAQRNGRKAVNDKPAGKRPLRRAPRPAPDADPALADLMRRLVAMQEAAHATPFRQETELVAEAVEELQTTLEEVRVAEDELRAAKADAEAERQRYRDLFQFAPDGYLVTSPKGSILEANDSAARLLGIPPRSLAGKPLVTYIHASDRTAFWTAINSMERRDDTEVTLQITPRARSRLVAQVTLGAVRDENQRVTALRWMLRDVTSQKQAEAALGESRQQISIMSSELLLAEERERRRIATDIHDHIGQALAVMQMRLGALKAACPQAVHAQVDELRALLAESVTQTRTLSFELSPPVLYELGLEAALQWLTEQKSRDAGKLPRRPGKPALAIEFRDDGSEKPLSQPVQILIFQAVRELLANVIRHASAAWARVSIIREDGEVVVSVEDDGVGFELGALHLKPGRTSGFGLVSVRERLSHVGGQLTLDNRPGGGAKVTLVVPLRPPAGSSSLAE